MQKDRRATVAGHKSYAVCVRSHTDCVTTSTKRPGRPPIASTNPPLAIIQSSNPSPSTSTSNSNDGVTADVQYDNVAEWFNLAALNTPYEWTLPDLPHVDVESSTLPTSGPNGTGCSRASPTAPASTTPSSAPPSQPGARRLSVENAIPNSHFPDGGQSLDGTMSRFPHRPSPIHHEDGDHGLWLSALHQDLSKQLFTLRSSPWDITGALRITCAHNNAPTADMGAAIEPAPANPLADIIKTSSDFTNLVHALQPPAPPASSSQPRLLSIAVLLTTLSCHILVLSIYDAILCHVLAAPAAVSAAAAAGPKLFLFGGVAVPQWAGSVLGPLLGCLVEGQLGPIEALLGLPGEFCPQALEI
ncbi:hypothetical protein BT67DRAFT_454828 [Trichocladium antarcticum]|uniref:Uncharacterized protein n=1 Tax=Trichocladium antarcticum TaxID=1450529 RepID=A0AAN6ZFZ0_9PEZI|nr:hypothetical protein BT67DRAFT_454828 [Trichocladium antarcticum]